MVALRKVRRIQARIELLLPRALLQGLIREVTLKVLDERETRFQSVALDMFQETAEAFLVQMFGGKYSLL